jgi:PBSX family phage terminase large subunit
MSKARNYVTSTPAPINIQHGAVRTGKTTNTLIATPKRMLQQAPKTGDIIFTGRTSETAYRNLVKPLQTMFGHSRVQYNKGDYNGSLGGRDFYVFGANDEKSAEKIQGLTVAWWLGDEVSLYPQNFVTMGLSRLSLNGSLADWTMNPQGPYHYIKTDFIDRAEEVGAKSTHYVLEDNRHNLAEGYIERLTAQYGGVNTLFGKRYILGQWVAAEGAIYDFWEEGKFTIAEYPKASYYTLCADYGTSNPTAVGLFGHRTPTPDNPLRCWLEDEFYYDARAVGRQLTDAETMDKIGQWLGDRRGKITQMTIDPSAASFQTEARRRGYQVRDADNSVIDGIRTQATMLQNGEYRVGVKCRQTIADYGAYLWDAKAQDRGEDKPLKQNDHTKDMERYELQTAYAGKIQDPFTFDASGGNW